MRVVAFGATDPGRKRSRNEDSFGILERDGLLVVADGMGGHRGGSVASKMAVEAVVTAFADAKGDHAGALDRMRGERSRIGTTEPMIAIGGGGLQGGAGAGGAKRVRRPSRGEAGRATTEPSLAALAQGTQPGPAPAVTGPAVARPQRAPRRVTLSDAEDSGEARPGASAAASAAPISTTSTGPSAAPGAAPIAAPGAASGVAPGVGQRLSSASLADLEDTPPVLEGDSGAQLSYSAALTLLQVSVRQAAAAIYTVSREERELQGMGTTLTAAIVEDDRLHVAHAGDSRCYLWRKGELRQVTEDHSWIAEQLRVGAITEKEAKQSRYRHVITRSIGVERHADVEVRTMLVKKGDRLLLCSDGLFGLVPDNELAELMGAEDLELLPARLIALANERGGDDNITAVVASLVPTRG